MKVAVISDLHSNRHSLEAVYEHIRSQGIQTIYCLGDVVGYGPQPEFCVDFVRGHTELCLMGNHDEALFGDASDFNPHARGAIEYTRRRMQPKWWHSTERKSRWEYLRQRPLRHQEGRFLFVHGSPRDPVREYVLSTDGFLNPEKLRSIFDCFQGVCLAGHTHHPGMHDESFMFHGLEGREQLTLPLPEGRRCFVNVGSTGQPRDGDPRACYAVLESHQITWHRVAYDFRKTMQEILDTGELSEVLARRLAMGK